MSETDPDAAGFLTERFVDNLPGLAYRCAPEPPWEMAFVGGEVRGLTGYPASAFEDGEVHYGDLVVEADRGTLERELAASIEADRQFTTTYRIETRGGESKHVFERGKPVTDADGDVVALEGLVLDITQRKRYEQTLERQNDLFAYTQDVANVGGWTFDTETGTLRWTEQVKRIFGVSPAFEPTLEAALDRFHPSDRETVETAIERAIDEADPYDIECRIVTADDEVRWVRTKGVPQVIDGEVVALRGAIQDVTDRRERERSLRDERAFREGLYEALPDLLYAFDEEGTLTRWNAKLEAVTGYTSEDIESMAPVEFVAPADRDAVREHIRRVFETGESIQIRAQLRTNEGETIPYEFTGALMHHDDGTHRELVGVGRDVSARLERQRRFEAVFNNTYQFTGLLNPDGTIIELNEASLQFMGADRSAVVGTPLWDALDFPDEADRRSMLAGYERVLGGQPYRDELAVQGADGQSVIDFSIRPITNDDGELTFLVPEGRDITAFKERERLVRVLHRLLRHNIRNDLNVIRGYADTLSDGLTDEDTVEYAAKIDAAAENLLSTSEKAKQMVDLILHPTAGDDTLTLGRAVQAIAERFRERYPDASIVTAVEDSVVVAADDRLSIALAQLVENGLEHNTAATPRVDLRVSERDGRARLEVADNGVGISPDEWKMVTEEVRKEPSQVRHGSGMGLLLTRWIVDEFDGRLSYATDESNGSVVAVRLPTA
ncbi:PAS domain-containing protein [Halovivax limisalsi]|uniref:PAS domain-containing protein n=1 Tax=Halovivax limisalsi TaxID=1453760 RepID=UPI001FFDB4BE|nr:PAS domain S-box protein [Halovivax limisalsi]